MTWQAAVATYLLLSVIAALIVARVIGACADMERGERHRDEANSQ